MMMTMMMMMMMMIQSTHNNSNLPPTRNKFRFPSGHSLYIFTLDNSNNVCQFVTSQNKQCTVYCSPKHFIILKQPYSLCPFMHCTKRVSPVQVSLGFRWFRVHLTLMPVSSLRVPDKLLTSDDSNLNFSISLEGSS